MPNAFGRLHGCALTTLIVLASSSAGAGGWAEVHRYVHKTGKCGAAREVLASQYRTGAKTASGARFDLQGLTAASHDYPLGTTITATNPLNGRSCSVRINDRGPYGKARETGVKIDFSLGAAVCLGISNAQYVCAP
jgi:rare lipoprotein A (peptidoglycan hydrolase)